MGCIDCLNWYGLGIGLRAAIMAQGRKPWVIRGARRSMPRPYHCKQSLIYNIFYFIIFFVIIRGMLSMNKV